MATYESKRYKRDKASIVPIEETYTEMDINKNDENVPTIGYRFDAPQRWVVAQYKNKAIGIRDLKLTPSSGDIRCKFLAFNKSALRGLTYTWDSEKSKYVKGNAWRSFVTGEYRCVSDEYNIQITPENNFEEIVTDMLKFVNDNSWKSIKRNDYDGEYDLYKPKTHDTSKAEFYYIEETSGNGRNKVTTEVPLDYTYNINYLKLPLTYVYEFDANKCIFNVVHHKELRSLLMEDHSNPTDRVKNNAKLEEYTKTISGTDYYYYMKSGFNISQHVNISDEGEEPEYLDTVYLGNGNLRSLGDELLLIVRLDEKDSIKAVYDLFNQPMPDDSLMLPIINLDGALYVVPFANKDSFKSHFAYGKGTTQENYEEIDEEFTPLSTSNNFIATNLKLNNVWDRLHLTFHTSFADTRHRIIGHNGDHLDTPNKQFIVPSGDQNQFYLRFTTDGTHAVLPIGSRFNVDLCFMLNPTRNTATPGNHDSFRD